MKREQIGSQLNVAGVLFKVRILVWSILGSSYFGRLAAVIHKHACVFQQPSGLWLRARAGRRLLLAQLVRGVGGTLKLPKPKPLNINYKPLEYLYWAPITRQMQEWLSVWVQGLGCRARRLI